ncbi:hypothetical protein FQN57_007007 [Myotisia sp. PD_48]|nr:hypothetical protein FQN57_007007 [Myotisia sp. PD_48]
MNTRLRIPFTTPFAPPIVFPPSANSLAGAIDAISAFLAAPPSPLLRGVDIGRNAQTVLLTGAGISVASGLADYRGENGTYRRNASFRPIYYHEFVTLHEARKRYWARSFIGWPTMAHSEPNTTHFAIEELGKKGYISSVITQNVDSFHNMAHPELPVIELHGYLRSVICVSCRETLPRDEFQERLLSLNPPWADLMNRILETGALRAETVEQEREKGLRMNPDGDVDVPGAHYSTFRYPACPRCLANPPVLADGSIATIEIDGDGAIQSSSNAGILKPAVVMFGESINKGVRTDAEDAIDEAGKLLVMGSSLATFSAWRLVERAQERGMAIGVLNVGGFRNEASLFRDVQQHQLSTATSTSTPASTPLYRVRCSHKTEDVLPEVVSRLPSCQ